VKPTALIATTTNWVPAARLAVALANVGFRVEVLCPSGHPVSKSRAASRTHAYQGLMPLRSLARAIATSNPDVVVPGDDLATRHLHDLYDQRELHSGDAAMLIRADHAWRTVQGMLRITVGRDAGEILPEASARPLLRAVGPTDLPGLRASLDALAEEVRAAFVRYVGAVGK